jgi:hypothetical protein
VRAVSGENVIDMRPVAGSLLDAVRFDRPSFARVDRSAWTSRNLLDCYGLTPRRVQVRLGTVLIGFDGRLLPLWSEGGARLIDGWPEQYLLDSIAERLQSQRPGWGGQR